MGTTVCSSLLHYRIVIGPKPKPTHTMAQSSTSIFLRISNSVVIILASLAVPSFSFAPSLFGWTPAPTPFSASTFTTATAPAPSSPIQHQQQRRRQRVTVLQISSNAVDDDDNASPSLFTQSEIQDMENLIVSLSQISDDALRREKMASLFDVELAAAASNDDGLTSSGSDGDEREVPRFAQLFQVALNTIGERVQASAREVASTIVATNDEDDDASMAERDGVGGDDNSAVELPQMTMREKSQEEMQLWALIDMMVQSKTRVKLHMGKLGSKGEFR